MNHAKHMNVMKKTGILIFWLAVWEVAALTVQNSLLVPSLFEILKALAEILVLENFCRIVFLSLGRILTGLFFAFMVGLILAVTAYGFRIAEQFLSPLFLGIKTIPIASYVILLLIWNGSRSLSIGISFLVALPIIYINILDSLKNTDKKMLQMADVFGMNIWNRAWYIYRPQISTAVLSSIKLACGMGIKAGVAAEIIGIPDMSFGEMLYMSKIYLDMDDLFAWTIVIVAASLVLEKILLWLFEILVHFPVHIIEYAKLPERGSSSLLDVGEISINNVTKYFHDEKILKDFSLHINPGEVVGIMSPSGSGKSTIFRMLLGLEPADVGNIDIKGRVAGVFQENLLCEEADVSANMKLVSSGQTELNVLAEVLFDKEDLRKKCSLYSGGMKRRAALLRALCTDFDILLMDEPFSALDTETKEKAAILIKKAAKNKTILLFTHNEQDVKLLNGVCYKYKEYSN